VPQSGEEQGLRQVGIYAVASTEESRLDACCPRGASPSGYTCSRRGAGGRPPHPSPSADGLVETPGAVHPRPQRGEGGFCMFDAAAAWVRVRRSSFGSPGVSAKPRILHLLLPSPPRGRGLEFLQF